MKYLLLRFFILVHVCSCCVLLWGQTDPVIYARHLREGVAGRADVRADIDLYHRQVNGNIYRQLESRRKYLQQTTSLDRLIADYMNRGFGVAQDTISLFTLFDGDNTIMAAYHHERGNLDSALMATSSFEKLTSEHIILLGEQELRKEEIKIKNRHIIRQKYIISFTTISLVLAIGALLISIRFYREKSAAYIMLAQKAKGWAEEPIQYLPPVNVYETKENNRKEAVTGEEVRIMSLAEGEMCLNYAYRDPDLTLELFAKHLGVNRNALSKAINRSEGSNFNQYVNSYRIKEAVRLISQKGHKDLYIEELYEKVGFGSRTSFYRIFKQFTGLSPAEFQKNIHSQSASVGI